MSASFAIVGPGRLGQALGRRWVEAGLRCVGVLGRTAASAERARTFLGAGRTLAGYAELRTASVVLLAVQDDRLAEVVAAAAQADAPRRCALWLHASGRFDLDVLAPLAAKGARLGSLHPLCPIPDPASGHAALPGKHACIAGEPRALRLLRTLAEKAGLVPFVDPGGDRALYHAACALASNGLTALFDLTRTLLATALGANAKESGAIVASLMRAALDLCAARGAHEALSGPAVRGDALVLEAHLRALARAAPAALPAYRALLLHAVELARAGGSISAARAHELARLLAEVRDWSS